MQSPTTAPLAQAQRRILCVLLAVFILTLPVGAAHAFRLFGKEPASALVLAQKGIDESSPDTFNKAIDVASIVNNATDALFEAMLQLAREGALEDSNLGLMVGLMGALNDSGQAGFIKQMLGTEVRGFVNAGIKSGYFSGKENAEVKASGGSLASLVTRLAKGRRELKAGKVLEEKDGKASMEAVFVDPKAGSFPLKLGLEEKDGEWRVVEILNARELFNEAIRKNQR